MLIADKKLEREGNRPATNSSRIISTLNLMISAERASGESCDQRPVASIRAPATKASLDGWETYINEGGQAELGR
jgi:hypothetical protein